MSDRPSQKEVAEAYMTGWGWADHGEDKFGCPYRSSIRKENILKGWEDKGLMKVVKKG